MTDKNEIIRALRLWFQSGDVFEIRVLDAVTAEWMRPHMESGYFDYEHIPDAADAIGKLRSYRGAYATVNPVNPDLLARACNRIRSITKEPTTADSDIAERRWLLVDCDPKRATGISSTDAEHDAALSMACKIRDGLAASGWPTPIFQDSGNGMQMMYRIDLTAVDNELVKHCIAGIATAGDDAVNIDTTVHNPARIWRLPGTMNCKGDSISTRPHRMAKILSVPDEIELVSPEQMECAASWEKTKIVANDEYTEVVSSFDLDNWIVRFCPELGQPKDWKGGRKWVFPVCPFNENHRNRSAVLLQEPSGAIAFKCHHDGCVGNDWKKLRVLKDPGCYDHPTPMKVNIDGILRQKPKAVEKNSPFIDEQVTFFRDPGTLPERLLHIPGFIDEFIDWAMNNAPHPNRELEFCGALTFLSYAVGRRIISDRNTLPNVYLVALADSGTGKDHPRKANMTAAIECGLGPGVIEDFTSGGGIEDALFLTPALLLQKDEMDTLFNMLKNAKDTNTETILEKLLRIYGSSNGVWKMRSKAMSRADLIRLRNEMRSGQHWNEQTILYPYLTIFGTAIPEFFYQSLSRRVLANGLAARCLLIVAGRRGPSHRPDSKVLPDSIRNAIEIIKGYTGSGDLENINPALKVIEATPDANEFLDELSEKYEGFYHKYETLRSQVAMAFWARAFEKILKLAMLYAVSNDVANPVITTKAVKWAAEFVEFATNQALFLVSEYAFENPFDEKAQKIIRYIRNAKGSIGHSILLHQSHESKEVFEKIIDTLIENETIAVDFVSTAGRTKKVYRLINR